MTLLWLFIGIVVLMALTFAGLLRVAARWGREMIELQQYGVEVTGLVLEKREYRSSRKQGRYIRYEYTDQFGRNHRRKVVATSEAWDAHRENGPIPIVYSQRRPNVSAPKYLLGVMSRAGASPDRGIHIRVDPPR